MAGTTPSAQMAKGWMHLPHKRKSCETKAFRIRSFFCELKNFLPCWSGAQPESDASSDDEPRHKHDKTRTKKSSKTQNLSLLQWVSAFDRYAIAAAATNQWPLHASMKHKDNCLRIANEAGPTRKHWLALVYDELCRKEWARRAYCEPDFDIAAE